MATQHQVQEIVQCGRDPAYFIKKYTKIQHPLKGLIPFDLYPFQEDAVQDLKSHRFNVILKSRQLGISTLVAAFSVWLAIFHRDKNILIIATKLDVAMNFITKVQVMIQGLPPWLMLCSISASNKQSVSFSHGSKIKAIPTSDSAGRSEALSLLIVDEAAFVPRFDTLWTALYPTLSTGGDAIILSTPNGVGGQYHKIYTDAEAGLNEFNPIKFMWDVHPERDQAWFDKETRNMSKKQIAQELLCVAGNTRIITEDGFKLAKEISVGDKVLTHTGNFKSVLKTHKRKLETFEKMYSISTPCNRQADIKVTSNHPLMVSNFPHTTSKNTFDHLKKNFDDIKYNFQSIDELNTKTGKKVFYLFPRYNEKQITNEIKQIDLSTLHECYSYNENKTFIKYYRQKDWTKRFVDVDFRLGKLIGLYLAEGSVSKTNKSGLSTQLAFHVNEELTHIKFVEDFYKEYGVRYRKNVSRHGTNCTTIETHNYFIAKLFKKFIHGDYAEEKLLNWDLLMKTNKEFITGLIVGHYDGDGDHKPEKKLKVVSVSDKLLYQMKILLSMYGHHPRVGYSTRKNGKRQPTYIELDGVDKKGIQELLLNTKDAIAKRQTRVKLIDNFFVSRIQYKESKQDLIDVFNFEVEDDHTYIADSIIVHNCNFESSGETFLSAEDIEYIGQTVKEPIARLEKDRNFWIWEHAQPGVQYLVSADIARGDSKDFSAAHILRLDNGEIVAEYKGKIPPDRFGELLNDVGRSYNNALMCPENNSFGFATIIKLRELNYPKMYVQTKKFDLNETAAYDTEMGSVGFNTNSKTRGDALTKFEELIRNKEVKIHSSRFLEELKTFIWSGSRAQAMKGTNDDLVMSLAIALWLYDMSGFINRDADKISAVMIQSLTKITNQAPKEFSGQAGSGTPFIPPRNPYAPYVSGDGRAPLSKSGKMVPVSFDWLLKK